MYSLRIIFAGTPEFAARHLYALAQSRHKLVGVYTQPDRRAGRGKKMAMSPVKQMANRYQIPVFQPVSLSDMDTQRQIQTHQADVMVVVAYGLILPAAVLQTPRYGCINVHASLLPRWRGAAPVQRAIAAGDQLTGITIMKMDCGLDTGPILLTARCEIQAEDTSAGLHDKLIALGQPALLEVLDSIQTLQPQLQDDTHATYASKISKQEARIDWSLSAEVIERRIRAFNPFPIACAIHKGNRFKVYRAEIQPPPAMFSSTENIYGKQLTGIILKVDGQGILVVCGEGVINILELQLPGKKIMSVREFLNGYPGWFCSGDRLD